ncbi:MAG: DUF3089 domain-containing protein [Bacteroidetes bacterium]|nr:MAG: DUF3089 domain-containing protein [Bacteroidota bacterium]
MTCLLRSFRAGFVLAVTFFGLACGIHRPSGFDPSGVPLAPDYSDLTNWAAHPDKADAADRTPCPDATDRQAEAQVDVFFLHPTTLTRNSDRSWNAALSDQALNAKTDSTTILYQATIFNGAGRVFAPRYRQAHLRSFYTRDTASADLALDLAYADVRAAFDYYLKHWNNGRPFIIAGHSQGGRHGMFLLRDLVETTPLEDQLVAAYLVGWPVRDTFFRKLQPCDGPDATGCFCTWRTYERDFALKKAYEEDVICTNPLNWTTQERVYVPRTENRGAVLRTFCAPFPGLCDAEVYKGVVMCTKPKFPGSVFFIRKNYHIGDMNLYYFNIRENAMARAAAFLKH